jgi:hypothetical protein
MAVIILISFLMLALIWNEMSHESEESLSVNNFLYYELFKAVPVVLLHVYLAIRFFEDEHKSDSIGIWICLLVLLP